MGQFDIVRSGALPSGPLGTVRARTDTRTGEGLIGRALEDLGGDLQQKVDEVQSAQDRLEVSTGQRRIRERIIAAQNSVTGIKENDDKIWANAEKEILGIQGNNRNVDAELQIFRDSTMPGASEGFVRKHTAKKAKNIHNEFEAEGQTLLANGDLIGYQSLLDARLASDDLTQAGYDGLTKSAFGDSLLQQARDLIASEHASENARGIGILDNMQSLEGVELSTEQLEYRNKLQKLAVKTTTEKSNATKQSIVIKMDNNRNMTAMERQSMAGELKQEAISGGITGEDTAQYFDMINKWSDQDEDPTEQFNPQVRAAVGAQIELQPESISADQLFGLVGLGADGGITTTQAIAFNERRISLIDKRPSMQKEMSGRKQEQLKFMFNDGAIGMKEYNTYADKLTEYSNLNKDFTRDEMDNFFDTMTTGTVSTWWKKVALNAASVIPSVAVGRMLQQKSKLRKMKLDKASSKAPPKDTRVVGMQADPFGDGSTWELKVKHDIPALDVWEEVE